MQVTMNMDGTPLPNNVPGVWRRRYFTHGKHRVDEFIVDFGGGHKKLVWCQFPFDQMIVNGAPNPLFHTNFQGNSTGPQEREARIVVRDEFLRHYDGE